MGVSLNAEIPHAQTSHQETHSYHQAVHHPHYGYGQPKDSCKVKNIVKEVEVCSPAFETVCETEEVQVKKIIDKEICFPVKKTVCTESISVEENELCTFSVNQITEETEAQGVEVSFSQECSVQMVTVCLTRGYDGHHTQCEERAQPFCYIKPEVSLRSRPVQVTYPGTGSSLNHASSNRVKTTAQALLDTELTVKEIDDILGIDEELSDDDIIFEDSGILGI